MRSIITGGSGLIGRALTAALARAGHEVIVLSRSPNRVSGLPAGARAVRWDGRTTTEWGVLVDGAMAIVNLAGAGIADQRWTLERRRTIHESRVNAGRAVVAAVEAAARKPQVVIQASAVGYYGPHGDEEVTEASPPGTDFLAGVCTAWESSTAAVETLGVRRAIIRTGIVLSVKGGALPRLLLPFKLFAGGPLGSGRQWYPWIHLADEVGAIRFLIEQEGASGPFNLSAPNPVTNGTLARAIGRLTGRPAFVRAPDVALRLAMGDLSMVVLEGQRMLPRRLLEAGFTFRFPTVEAALRDLLSP